MRIIVSFIAAALLSVGLSAPAQAADHRPCVTPKESRIIDRGDTMRKVTRVFDDKGWVSYRSGKGQITRNYHVCTDFGLVQVNFNKKKVTTVHATWHP